MCRVKGKYISNLLKWFLKPSERERERDHARIRDCAMSVVGYKPRASSDYLETSYLMMNPAERETEPKDEETLLGP